MLTDTYRYNHILNKIFFFKLMLVTVRLRSHTLTYIHSQINLEELPFWGGMN